MSPHKEAPYLIGRGFPRVSGDEPFADGSLDGIYKFSPRERG